MLSKSLIHMSTFKLPSCLGKTICFLIFNSDNSLTFEAENTSILHKFS